MIGSIYRHNAINDKIVKSGACVVKLDYSSRNQCGTRVNPIADADTSVDAGTSGFERTLERVQFSIRHQNHLLNSRAGRDPDRGRPAQGHIDLHGDPGPTPSVAADEQYAPLVSEETETPGGLT